MPQRTEPASATSQASPAALIAALADLIDYGIAWANKAGAITIPAQAREELGLASTAHWRIFGSPALGIAVLVGPRRTASDALGFLLEEDPDESARLRQ